ncbi:MAG: GAF domain-containing protein [Candidatus Rokuibacteriota bacterium]
MARRRRLFWKYVIFFSLLVTVALLASGLIEIYFSYQESKVVLSALQREKAQAAAVRIEGFITEIERQMGWVIQPRAAATAPLEQRRVDFYRLQRQVPPITEITYIDPAGREQVRISRLAMEVFGSNIDLSADPRFTEARANRLYRGPVYFRKESEPYMAIAIAEGKAGGVTAVEVNLKFIWDVVSQIRVGKAGQALVVDGQGALIAHPDISLVLQKTDLGRLEHVKAALTSPPALGDGAGTATVARNLKGERVLTAHVAIPSLGWTVFVEQPLEEAFAPLEASVRRTALLEMVGIALSVIVSLILARTMVKPIRALQAGAARFGEGNLTDRIVVRTGDELEGLAEQFNSMAGKLQESYAGLERKVDERTHELTESLEQQTATAEILGVISSSPTDLQPVMAAVVEAAARLCDAQNAQIFQIEGSQMRLVARHGPVKSSLEAGEARPLTRGSVSGRVALERRTIRIDDLRIDLEAEYPDIAPAIRRQGIAATVGVPLLREGVAIGAITAFRTDVRPFSDQQVALLETFADQAVIAIENVRLFQELQVRNRALTETLEQQTATAEILSAISSSPTDLQPILDTVAQNAGRVCDATDALVLQVDGAFLQLVANYGEYRGRPTRLEISPDWVGGRAVLERRTIHVPDLAAELAEYPQSRSLQERAGNRTTLVTPMLREGTPIGVIVIRRLEVRPFTDKQIALLQTFADQAVIAIENVRLFQELRARTHDLSQSLEETGALSEVIRAVSSSLDLREILDTVARRAIALSGADGCGIFELSPERKTFDVVVSQGLSREFVSAVQHLSVGVDHGTISQATAAGQPVQIPDVEEAHDYPFRALFLEEGLRAVLTVPMGGGDIARGIVVVRRRPGDFDERIVSLMTALANQSKVAIANAHLFREIEEKSQLLEVADRHKSEFLASMSHELRTPLNAIIGFSEVLLQRMFGELNPKQDEYLQDVLSSGRHLLSLINDILDLSKVEAGRMDLELARFHLPQAIQDTLILVRERAVRHGIDVTFEVDGRLGEFVADERKVKQVMLNLLSNAVKFTPEGGRIEVRAVPTDGGVEISVADTGIGIAPENQELIFEEFRQVGGDYAHKREGTGLGLTLARKLVELHGGRLWVKSQVGQGSTFTFSVPERPWPAS